MADNGYGSIENSADFNLRVYLIRPDLETKLGGSGRIAVERFIEPRARRVRGIIRGRRGGHVGFEAGHFVVTVLASGSRPREVRGFERGGPVEPGGEPGPAGQGARLAGQRPRPAYLGPVQGEAAHACTSRPSKSRRTASCSRSSPIA